jgi:hypothetical protein
VYLVSAECLLHHQQTAQIHQVTAAEMKGFPRLALLRSVCACASTIPQYCYSVNLRRCCTKSRTAGFQLNSVDALRDALFEMEMKYLKPNVIKESSAYENQSVHAFERWRGNTSRCSMTPGLWLSTVSSEQYLCRSHG